MFWFTLAFLISQILAWVAIISDIFSFQFKERKKIIIFFIISAIAIMIHYFLLERYVAAGLLFLGIIRFFTSYHNTQRYWIYIFITLFGLATYILYKDIYDLIIFVGTCFITIWVFQANDKWLRLFMMLWTSCVIAYNFLIFSPVGVLLETVFLIEVIWFDIIVII